MALAVVEDVPAAALELTLLADHIRLPWEGPVRIRSLSLPCWPLVSQAFFLSKGFLPPTAKTRLAGRCPRGPNIHRPSFRAKVYC